MGREEEERDRPVCRCAATGSEAPVFLLPYTSALVCHPQ